MRAACMPYVAHADICPTCEVCCVKPTASHIAVKLENDCEDGTNSRKSSNHNPKGKEGKSSTGH